MNLFNKNDIEDTILDNYVQLWNTITRNINLRSSSRVPVILSEEEKEKSKLKQREQTKQWFINHPGYAKKYWLKNYYKL